jgi:DNA modification methylase
MKPYYEDGKITIYHGDCREIAWGLGRFDVLLTDPPYGIGADLRQRMRAGKKHGKAAAPSRDYGDDKLWDQQTPQGWVMSMLTELARWSIIWGGNHFELMPSKAWLVWDKQNGDNGYADCEMAWTNLNQSVRMMRHRWMGMIQAPSDDGDARVHPTQKPVPLMRWCLGFVPDAECVIDPFMGSGTTLRAAKDLGLHAVGIDLNERYCEIAAKRMAQEALDLGGAA